MKKILIIQRIITHYRMPLFLELAKKYDITLAYSDKNEDLQNRIKSVKLSYPTGKECKEMSVDAFEERIEPIISLCKDYDVVVTLMEPMRKILYFIEELRKHTKVVVWGIGVAASYDTRYDSIDYRAPSFESMIAMADAAIVYTDYPKKKYIERGIPGKKIFVANNTVDVLDIEMGKKSKDYLLFVGTLLKQKKIDALLQFYKQAYEKNKELPMLKIIGEGEEAENLYNWIKDNNLSHKVDMVGAVYEEEVIADYFAGAIATVSADQAGLSVLKAMGYGVPFIAKADAITGGEIFNIQNGVNGIIFNEMDELEEIFLDIADNKDKYIEMGENAYQYYYSCRTIKDYARGYSEALEYALSEV